MDELMMNNELKTFADAIQALVDLDESTLDDETLKLMIQSIEANMTPMAMQQAINEVLNNLEMQGQTRREALEAVKNLKDVLTEAVYGEKNYTGNKKILIDTVLDKMFAVFDAVTDRYHSYAIELPMTVDTGAGAKVPTYAHETDAAADLYSMTEQIIPARSRGNMIRTGVRLQLPEGWLAMILPRSSMGVKTPLRLSNSVGLIDSGYRGELGVIYDNISDEDYVIAAGDRIAQLLVMPSYRFQAKVVDILADSDRGEGGFGSSGQ